MRLHYTERFCRGYESAPRHIQRAARLRIPFLGSLGILREAKLRGMIPVVRPDLDTLRAYHFRVSDVLYQTFIQQMGEA